MAKKVVKFKIKRIAEDEFFIQELEQHDKDIFDHKKLKVNLAMNFQWDVEQEVFDIILAVTYTYHKTDQPVTLLSFKGITEFQIAGLQSFKSIVKDNTLDLPDGLLENMLGIAYSTTRGIIACRTAGTYINQFFLPIIAPKQLLPKPKEKATPKPMAKKKTKKQG